MDEQIALLDDRTVLRLRLQGSREIRAPEDRHLLQVVTDVLKRRPEVGVDDLDAIHGALGTPRAGTWPLSRRHGGGQE